MVHFAPQWCAHPAFRTAMVQLLLRRIAI